MRTSSGNRRAYLGSWLAFAVLGLGRAATAGAAPAGPTKVVPQVPAPSSQTLTSDGAAALPASTCVQDDPVLTPRNWHGWDRSAVIAWEAVEQAGGIVPEIEEDGTQAPPRWWRYPSALRSAALLAAEAKNARGGLYDAVAATALAKGDILVRTVGAGVCGKMVVLGGKVEGQWLTIEVDPEDGHSASSRAGNPLFFAADGHTLLAPVRAYRIRVRKDETIGHVRELERDLGHLEATIGDRPLFLAAGDEAREIVAQKVHDLIDEGWSLLADETFDVTRRELVGRAWVLAAYLDWPGARVQAAAVLDDVLARSPGRPAAAVARGALALLEGDFEQALAFATTALAAPELPPRAFWVAARALAALGRTQESQAMLTRLTAALPRDVRSRQRPEPLKRITETEAAAARAPHFLATADAGGVESAELGFRIRWPLTWRVLGLTSSPETGLLGNFMTGRVLLDDGRADRAAAVLLAQRPATAAARAVLLREGARKMFPSAKLKVLPSVASGSRREQFRDKDGGVTRMGEVTTIERAGVVYFLVMNAPADVYPKLRDQYLDFVRSLAPLPAAGPVAAAHDRPGAGGAGGAPVARHLTGAGGEPGAVGPK